MSQRLKRAAAAAGEEEEEDEEDEEQKGPDLGGLSTNPKGDFGGDSAVIPGAGSMIDLGADAASSVNLEEASYGKGSAGTTGRNNAEKPFADGPSASRTGRGDGDETFRAHGGENLGESSDGGGRGESSGDMLKRSRQGVPAGDVAERAGALNITVTEAAGGERDGGGYGGSKRARACSAGPAGAANTADKGKRPSSPRLKRLEARTKPGGRKRTGDGGDGGGEDGPRGRPRESRHKASSVGSCSAKRMSPSSGGSQRRVGTTPALRKKQERSGATLGHRKVGRSRLDEKCVLDIVS